MPDIHYMIFNNKYSDLYVTPVVLGIMYGGAYGVHILIKTLIGWVM